MKTARELYDIAADAAATDDAYLADRAVEAIDAALAESRASAEGKWIAFLREHGERAVVLLRQEDEFRVTDTPLVDTLESLVAEVSP